MEMEIIKPLIILVDFDSTCVSHEFPNIGKDIGAVPVLKELVAAGHKLILHTIRCNTENTFHLTAAEKWFKDNDIPLYGINDNPSQHSWSSSRKVYGNYSIDDLNVGTPLKTDLSISSRPFVDWEKMREILVEMNILK